MRKTLFSLLYASILASCSNPILPNPEGKDARSLLEDMAGPKVSGVDETLLKNAEAAEKDGNFKAAASIYRQIFDRKRDDAALAYRLAEAERRAGAFDSALELYNAILAKEPDMLPAKEGKGLALLGKGDFDNAGNTLVGVYRKDGARWRTLNALGILLASQQRYPDARFYFGKALERTDNSASVLNNLALTHALERDLPQAEHIMRQAISQPGLSLAIRKRAELNLALIYAAGNNLKEAEAVAGKYFSGPALRNNLGLYAHLANDDALARTYFNMALTESTTYYERAWQNLDALNGRASSGSATDGKAKRVVIHPSQNTYVPAWIAALEGATSSAAPPLQEPKKTMLESLYSRDSVKAAPVPQVQQSPVQDAQPVKEVPAPITPPAEPAGLAQPPAPAANTPVVIAESPDEAASSPIRESAAPSVSPEHITASPQQPTEQETSALPSSSERKQVKSGFQALGNWVTGIVR